MALKKFSNEQITLGIHPTTRMLSIKQGDNVIHMTRDQVNGLKGLKDGKYETNTYTSWLSPRNQFKLQPTGCILAEYTDEYNQATILINSRGFKGILDYVEANKGRIAWDREFRRR